VNVGLGGLLGAVAIKGNKFWILGSIADLNEVVSGILRSIRDLNEVVSRIPPSIADLNEVVPGILGSIRDLNEVVPGIPGGIADLNEVVLRRLRSIRPPQGSRLGDTRGPVFAANLEGHPHLGTGSTTADLSVPARRVAKRLEDAVEALEEAFNGRARPEWRAGRAQDGQEKALHARSRRET
jgi:hypothetical protein